MYNKRFDVTVQGSHGGSAVYPQAEPAPDLVWTSDTLQELSVQIVELIFKGYQEGR